MRKHKNTFDTKKSGIKANKIAGASFQIPRIKNG